jgi:hypothetical protein
VYKVAADKINEGLSLFPRLLLALVSTLFGLVMVLVAPPTDKAPFFYAFGVLCLTIAIACVTRGRTRQFAGSVIGSVLLVGSLAYLTYELRRGPVISGSRSEPSVINAGLFFFAFGIPGAAYVLRARFGLSSPKSLE